MDYFYWWKGFAEKLKLAWSQKVFHFGSNLQQRCQITILKNIYIKKKMLKVVIWHLFLEIWATVKKLSEIKLSLVNS